MSNLLKRFKLAAYLTVSSLAIIAQAQPETRALDEPLLITFGPSANTYEGDHDYQQVVRISVPADYEKTLFFRLFDADIGGTHDEMLGRANSEVKYSLYGANGAAFVKTDINGEHNETVTGRAIQQVSFGNDPEYDNRWTDIFEFEASQGKLIGKAREFFVLVEGLSGDDGNVFDVQLSAKKGAFEQVDGGELYTYLPTFRVAALPRLTELVFRTPENAAQFTLENFDAAGAEVKYHTPFQSQEVRTSGQNEWVASIVDLTEFEKGDRSSITMRGGLETPNDASLFVTNEKGQPLAIRLPLMPVMPNERPIAKSALTPKSCSMVEFNASGSHDPDGTKEDLSSYQWILESGMRKSGKVVQHSFLEPGTYQGRLEVFDHSNRVANGDFEEFEITVKAPPIAAFIAPDVTSQTAKTIFDASGSKPADDGLASRIASYIWDMGNGEIIESKGPVLRYRYPEHGQYQVSLKAVDDSGHPCNSAEFSQNIFVDAPPIADAGGDISTTVGKIVDLSGKASSDPDGSIISYIWNMEDNKEFFGQTIKHAFHEAGQYPVTLHVLDNSGLKGHTTKDKILITVTDKPNIRPIAEAGADFTVETGEVASFSSLNSKDEDGKILQTLWDFGDGNGGSKPEMEHTFWETGTYIVSLTVKDDSGQLNDKAVDSIHVTVVDPDNKEPIIALNVPESAFLYDEIIFDASASDDRDGSIISYNWEFGDGAFSNKPVASHTYKKPGLYSGSLTIVDSDLPTPGEVVKPFEINISKKVNIAPIANAGPNQTAFVHDEIEFDGASSQDQDGSIILYEWDFGDGEKATGITPKHSYQFAGTYEVTLTVTDNDQSNPLASSEKMIVNITNRDNQPPAPRIENIGGAVVSQILTFDGSQSSDPDGNITSYLWDFGNGDTSEAERPVYAYHEPGTYRVKLTVQDDDIVNPLTGTYEIEVDVRSPENGGADQ